jgi:transcriptional regulator with XRE-family HTH domain
MELFQSDKYMKKNNIYKNFGNLLIELRQKAGIIQQIDLARRINVTQQTVSRWELGFSRPRYNQLATIAAPLGADPERLLSAAGYTIQRSEPAVISFDLPFPMNQFPDWKTFERFCDYFLNLWYKYHPEYKGANVHPFGTQGDKQGGIDIKVTLPRTEIHTFQCKHERKFGPAAIEEAVKEQTIQADKKYLLLSCTASSKARDKIATYPDWDIWDIEDISRKIRQELPKEEQIKLVDTFFPGQHLALLGSDDAGPWQTAEKFFEPFLQENRIFNHCWNLVGRADEVNKIREVLADSTKNLVLIEGPGGIGKSRILKEVTSELEKFNNQGCLIRFLGNWQKINQKNLEDLGEVKKLLILDDAHDDTENLPYLLKYAASPSNNAKILLTLRPYGLSFIKNQALQFGLDEESIETIKLDYLTLDQVTNLAIQVLEKEKFENPEKIASYIAKSTIDCPLVTVIGAQILAKENIDFEFEFIKENREFHNQLFSKFEKVIIGKIGQKNGDEKLIEKLFKVLSLIQPFEYNDSSIPTMLSEIERISPDETKRLISILLQSGILFKRVKKCRLSPDMLADFIIEKYCIDNDGHSTGYIESFFTIIDQKYEKHVENFLKNLGKLDWRKINKSNLLAPIWNKIISCDKSTNTYIKSVTKVAYYQPEQALNFVRKYLSIKKNLSELPEILKYVTYNSIYLSDACKLLWELRKYDKITHEIEKYSNQNTAKKAIQILSDLCEIRHNKSMFYTEKIVEFCLSLLEKKDSWLYKYTPFDTILPILNTEGEVTEYKGNNIIFKKFSIPINLVCDLRNKVIDAAIELLSNLNLKIAILSAKFLGKTIRCYSISKNDLEIWNKEFSTVLEKIEKKIHSQSFDFLVLAQIARSVSWHANYNNGDTTIIARRIINGLPTCLEFQITLTLIDSEIFIFKTESPDYEEPRRGNNKNIEKLANSIIENYSDMNELYIFIEKIFINVKNNFKDDISPYPIYQKLTQLSLDFSKAFVSNILKKPDSEMAQFVSLPLLRLLKEPALNILEIVHALLNTSKKIIHEEVSRCYNREKYEEEDIFIIKKMLISAYPSVLKNVFHIIKNISKQDYCQAIKLLKEVNISGLSPGIIGDMLSVFSSNETVIPFQLLTEEDVKNFLDKLVEIPDIDNHWIDVFLENSSKYYPNITIKFFMRRVELSAESDRDYYKPVNLPSQNQINLRFRESSEFVRLIRALLSWIQIYQGNRSRFYYEAARLLKAIFITFDREFINFFSILIDTASESDFYITSILLREADEDFVFKNQDFILKYLEKAESYGSECYELALDSLFSSAFYGRRSSIVGQQSPKDIQIKENASEILNALSDFSPAYRLYKQLKENSEMKIKQSMKVLEYFEN